MSSSRIEIGYFQGECDMKYKMDVKKENNNFIDDDPAVKMRNKNEKLKIK